MKTLLLKKDEVSRLIRLTDVIGAVEEAYRAFNSDQVEQPAYTGLHLEPSTAEIDFKLSHHKSGGLISMKASSGGFTDNPALYGVPNGMGTILLFDARSGALACVMEGSLITGLRTGAAGAVSVKALARKEARSLASIGTGNQARMQIRAIREVMEIEVIHASDRDPQALARFKADMEAELGIPVVLAESIQNAVTQADIVITTTRGSGPVVKAGWVRPGTHIIAIGADQKGKQELDPEIFRQAKVVVDSLSQCAEKGETQHPLREGILARSAIHAEIGEILLGRKPGRETDTEVTIFDSTGMAIQDNTTAGKIYRNALDQKVGTFFNFLQPVPLG
jgi:alanine dehydrogenase